MADFLKNILGGGSAAAPSAVPAADPDFADFATAASPVAPSHAATSVFTAASPTSNSVLGIFGGGGSFFGSMQPIQGRPYTKWYRIWERVTVADFYQELVILPVLLLLVLINIVGTRWNKAIARQWAVTHVPLLEAEFAQVGFTRPPQGQPLAKALADSDAARSADKLKQKALNEYTTYATGRQNVAWLDIYLKLHTRFNPLIWFFQFVVAFLFDSMETPSEKMEAIAYCFDGKEKATLPQAGSVSNSTYDGFVWAVVHKDHMKRLRDERYDLSLTTTREHPKLPPWATIMSESSEISDALLTPALIKAIESEGEELEALIITDMPVDAPKKLDQLIPKKRVILTTKLSTSPNTALFNYYLRLPDLLVHSAHYRPEAMRKIRATREEETRKIRKLDEGEKAAERKDASDKMKKEERDRKLKGMTAEEQRKFLDKERGDQMKRGQKRMTVKG